MSWIETEKTVVEAAKDTLSKETWFMLLFFNSSIVLARCWPNLKLNALLFLSTAV